MNEGLSFTKHELMMMNILVIVKTFDVGWYYSSWIGIGADRSKAEGSLMRLNQLKFIEEYGINGVFYGFRVINKDKMKKIIGEHGGFQND